MFKKLKEKITEEVKSSPQRFAEFTQTVSDKLQNNTSTDENFFTIGEEDANTSTNSADNGFSSVSLVSPSQETRSRRLSNSSMASDVSFLPKYESGNMYHLQSDWDASASEMEDNASTASSQLGHLSKEQIYSAFQKSQMRYHKYRGRYTDLARHYKDLERENAKMKSVLVETQDKAIRRVSELKEQCTLEQKAKAHLESSLRDEMEEKSIKIQTLQTKIGLLQSGNNSDLLVDADNKENNSENLENLTKYLNDARKEIESLNEKIQEMKANSIIFQSKEQEYKTKILKLEKEITQFSEREKENNLKLAQSKMELHNEIVIKDAEMSNLKKENETLKQKLETAETEQKSNGSNVKMENLQSQNKKLIDKVESLTQKCNILENDLLRLESYKIEIQELKEREELLNTELNDLKKTNEEAGLDKKLLEELVENLKLEKSKFEETLAKEKKNFEEQLFSMREDAKKALLSLEPKIREKLQTEQMQKEQELKREFATRIEELSSSGNNIKEMQMKIYEKDDLIKKYVGELDILKEELSKRIDNYSDLEKSHLQLIEESSKLRNTIANLEKEKSNFENYEEKIARMQAHIETLQEEIRELSDISEKKEEENVFLSKENLNLQQSLSETHQKLRILEEKYEAIHLDTSESKLLELKLQKLEEEKKSLMDEFESERKMFNEMLLDHKELKQKEEMIMNLEETLSKTHFELNHSNDLYYKEKEKNVMLFDKKHVLEQEAEKLRERIRIFEEKDEAINLDKSESGLLELKLQKLEEENKRLLATFELERVTLEKELDVIKQDLMDKEEVIMEGPVEQSVENTNLKDKIHFIRQLSEVKEKDNIFLSKENINLQQENTKLLEKVRVLEEKYEAITLNSTESKLLEIKLQKLEEENKQLLDEFEMERKMFNKMLEDRKELAEREQVISELQECLHKAHEEVVQLKEALAKEKEETIYLQKRKLDFEKKIEKLMEHVRILEEKEEVSMLDKNESNLLEMKLQKLETEKANLLETFELERKTFNKYYEEYVKNENKLKALVEENLDVKEAIKRGKKEVEELGVILKKTAEAYQETQKENQQSLEKINELNEKIKQEQAEVQKLQNSHEEKISELNTVNEKLKTELKRKDEVVSELSKKITDLSGVIEKQTTDFNSLLDRTKRVESVLEKMRLDSTEMIKQEKEKQNKLTLKIEELQKELQEKTDQFADLSKKLAELEDAYNQEKNKHKERMGETESLKKKLEELQHLERQFREEKQGLNKELNNFKVIQKEKSSLESKLKQTENDLKAKNGEFKVLEQECNLLKEEKENLLGEIKNLRDRIGDLTQENNNLKTVSFKVTESEYKLGELQNQNQALQSERDNLSKEMSELNLRINRISADNRHNVEENQTLIHNSEELKIKMEYLEKEKGEFDEIRSKLMQEITILTNTVDEIRQQLHDVQRQNAEMVKEKNSESSSGMDITQIQHDFYEIKEKCDSLFVENKNLKSEYTKLEEKCNDFGKIKKKLETQISELENQYMEILHEKQLLQDEVQELKISPLNSSNPSKLDHLTILKQEKAFTTDTASTSNSDKLLKEIDVLQDKLTQYKSLDITNKSSIEFFENELQKVKNQNEKLNRKLDETLVTLNHCTELSTSTEVEYLKNVLYNYMLGKESIVLARVIAAVCKFDPHQTEAVLQREQQKQTLLGQLGLI